MKSLLERPDDQAGHEGHSHEHGGIFGMNTELIFALICGALLGAGALAGKLGLIDRLPLILYVSAYVFGGWFTTKEAVTNIRQKRFEIDSLMLRGGFNSWAQRRQFVGRHRAKAMVGGQLIEGVPEKRKAVGQHAVKIQHQ